MRKQNTKMNKITIVLLFALSLSTHLHGQNNYQNLTKELSEKYKKSSLTGFAVAVISADSILYKEAFGYENIKTKSSFSLEKRFYVASISKTFIGISLMKLVEEGRLKLATPINSILPFKVVNPNHKNLEITIEQLARHTSSIVNGDYEKNAWYLDNEFMLTKKEVGKMAYNSFKTWEKNSKIELGDFLKESLSCEGKLYSKKYFSKKKPGEQYEYTNLGAALAAYIIELKTGVQFDKYVEGFVTNEMNFKRGVWRQNVPHNKLPTSYFQTKIESPVHHPSLYPTGGMILSCNELTLYLKEMINGYNGNSKILKPDSFKKMMSTSDTKNNKGGIFWELNANKVGHNGGNYGVTCFMSFDKTTGIGKVFMSNISPYKEELLEQMIAVWKKLDEYETKIN